MAGGGDAHGDAPPASSSPSARPSSLRAVAVGASPGTRAPLGSERSGAAPVSAAPPGAAAAPDRQPSPAASDRVPAAWDAALGSQQRKRAQHKAEHPRVGFAVRAGLAAPNNDEIGPRLYAGLGWEVLHWPCSEICGGASPARSPQQPPQEAFPSEGRGWCRAARNMLTLQRAVAQYVLRQTGHRYPLTKTKGKGGRLTTQQLLSIRGNIYCQNMSAGFDRLRF